MAGILLILGIRGALPVAPVAPPPTGSIQIEYYLLGALGASAGSAAEVTVADISVEADDLVVTLPTVELPSVDITVEAMTPSVSLPATPVVFSHVSPEPGAWAYRGPDRVSVDVTSPVPSSPVVEGSIMIEVDGTALTVSTIAIAGGFRATAPYRFNDEQEYAVEITAETTTSAAPTVLSYDFLTAYWVGSTVSVEGVATGGLTGAVALSGSAMAVAAGLACLSGSSLTVLPGYLRLDGSVGISLDLLRTGEAVILDGWVTLYVSEMLLFVVIQAGEPVADAVDVAGDFWTPVAAEAGGDLALDVYSVSGHYGIDQAFEVRQPVTHLVEASVQAGEPVADSVPVAVELEGYAASGMVVLDSPSAEWADEELEEDA